MKHSLMFGLAVLILSPCAYGQNTTVSETTQLNNITAQGVPASIKSAQDLDQLTCNFHDNSVTARGSQEAVAAFEKELHAADVPRAQYRMAVRLARYQVDAQGKYTETVVANPIITTTDKTAGSFTINNPGQDGFTLAFTPETSTDKAVKLAVQVQELGEQAEVISEGKNTRTVPLGATVRITGMTEAADKPLRRAVQQGEIVTDRGAYTGYYVEVTPALVTSPTASTP